MILVDTSVWIEILKDQNGHIVKSFQERIALDSTVLTRFNQIELLQGSRDQKEWTMLDDYLSTQYYLEASNDTWRAAARIYFDLRRRGLTINSPIDCCIAQIAMEHDSLLLHRDRDFERVSRIRPLHQERFDWR
jgi:predicted nucleic acid-binding protein